MEMTFYKIHNPTSSELGAAGISQLRYVKEEYDRAFLAIKHLIKMYITREDKGDSYEWIFWAQIPSERLPNVYYDVICTTEMAKSDTNFKQAKLKLWSNVPSFLFNYTYVLNSHNLIPSWLLDKCKKKALVDKPKIRNPLEIWHLEKYIVLFKRYFFSQGYLNIKHVLEDLDLNLTKDKIKNEVSSQEEKLIQAGRKKKDIDADTSSSEL